MKKIITLILVFGMIITATACGASSANTGSNDAESKKDTTSLSEKKEENVKNKEDEKYGYIYYRNGFEVKVPKAFRADKIISEPIFRIMDNSIPGEEQEYILISSLPEENIEPSRLKEIPQILEPQVQKMMNKYKPSRFYKTFSQKYDSVEECEYNGYKMLKAKGSITGTNFDGDEEKTVNYVAYYFLITADTGYAKFENAPTFIISYTEKTDKDSLKNIEEYADVAAKSIKESTI
jgi:hypothetical protein